MYISFICIFSYFSQMENRQQMMKQDRIQSDRVQWEGDSLKRKEDWFPDMTEDCGWANAWKMDGWEGVQSLNIVAKDKRK